MSVLVIDASIVVKWFIPEVHSAEARHLLESSDQYVAPDLLFAEVANTIWKKVMRGELSGDDAQRLVNDIESIAVTTVPCRELAADAHALALATGRTVYDAMYLALAIRLKTRLLTADKRLANAVASIAMIAKHVQLIAASTS